MLCRCLTKGRAPIAALEALLADVLEQVFWAHHDEHPLCHGRGSAMPDAAVSDLLSRRDWHRTAIYAEYMRPMDVEHLVRVDLGHPPGQTNVLLLDRASGRDFDDRDRLVLTLLRPHLASALRRYIAPVPRLTPRECEVLALVREGLTNRAIARQLDVSPQTVRKHLENVFARLGVHSRTAAVAALTD